MVIRKGQRLTITMTGNVQFDAIASKGFDTDRSDYYPLVLDQDKLHGTTFRGESVFCQRILVLDVKVRKRLRRVTTQRVS